MPDTVNNSYQTIQIICGPTASGKTGLALKFAKQDASIEIISADTRQFIKHLNIGTAKPTEQERRLAKFHLIDIIELGEKYTSFQFIDDATKLIDNMIESGKTPLIVGGSGMYLRSLTEGVVEIDQSNNRVREELQSEIDKNGPENLYKKLQEVDPEEASNFHMNNHVRLIRAMEIYLLTGKSKTEIHKSGKHKENDYSFQYNFLLPDREKLYEIINSRVEEMIELGWLKEIENLIELGLKENIKKANVIGYNELIDYIDNVLLYDDAISLIKQRTRNYAKRQYTWFSNQVSGRVIDNSWKLEDLI